jgi:hypothetical protein
VPSSMLTVLPKMGGFIEKTQRKINPMVMR